MSDFRVIPSIDELRRRPAIRALESRYGAATTLHALREATADLRRAIGAGGGADSEDAAIGAIERHAETILDNTFGRSLESVINATGVIVHTNLGRAPLSAAAIARVADVAAGYASLEYDIGRGARGRRDVHAEPLLCRLTGAEAAVVVNNNAAATLLILAALANGREVIVSRGELVEIGGGFRIPDVMAQSGAILREVGTTNKTRAADYAAAVTERTALILRVHPSNFRIEGFTARPSLEELVAVGQRLNIPVVEDLGSGFLANWSAAGAAHPLARVEPSVEASLAAGVDVCCFSGDKLLGGPQAGIIAGRSALLARIRVHPLMRALRVDKMSYAALEATLAEYLAGRAASTIPVQRMIAASADAIRARAEALASTLSREWRVEIVAGSSAIGGGSAPAIELPTWLIAIAHARVPADRIEEQLRLGRPAIIARIERDRVLLDLRTVLPEMDRDLASALTAVVQPIL